MSQKKRLLIKIKAGALIPVLYSLDKAVLTKHESFLLLLEVSTECLALTVSKQEHIYSL